MSGDPCQQTHAWAVAARQRRYRKCQHQLAIDTLEECLAGSCDPDSAASRLTAPYATLLKQDVDEVGELWGMMCDAIKALGVNIAVAERLTRLINAISRLPDVTDNDGKAMKCRHGLPGVYWRGLPGFAMMFREYAVDIEPETCEMPDLYDWTDPQRAKLLSVSTFGAKYLSCGQHNLGMAFHAYCSFKDMSEAYDYTTSDQLCQYLETVVPSATAWILIGGKKIYELSKHGTPYHSLGLWTALKTSFEKVTAVAGLRSSVKLNASQAYAKMCELDAQSAACPRFD